MFTRIKDSKKVDRLSTVNKPSKKMEIISDDSIAKFEFDGSESPSPQSVSDDSLFNIHGATSDEIIGSGKKVKFNTIVTVINNNNSKVIRNQDGLGSPKNLPKKKAFIKHLKLEKSNSKENECVGCSFDPNEYVGCSIS